MMNQGPNQFSYIFTDEQVKDLAIFFRKNDNVLPKILSDFSISLQNYLYSTMTIDEAERFFSERT